MSTEEVFADEFFRILDFTLFGKARRRAGKLFSPPSFSAVPFAIGPGYPIVPGDVGDADLHVVTAAEKIQNLFFVVALDPISRKSALARRSWL